jgi:hypothetical protein
MQHSRQTFEGIASDAEAAIGIFCAGGICWSALATATFGSGASASALATATFASAASASAVATAKSHGGGSGNESAGELGTAMYYVSPVPCCLLASATADPDQQAA